MESIRKWFYRPKRDDTSLLAQFFYANDALTAVACELDSFDGRQEQERCTTLVNQLRHCQDKVLTICNQIMDELFPDSRANRDFRVKFPDDVMQENLAGQLWFGAECLAAGSSIMNREVESSAMRPLAKALTKSLEIVRNLLRELALKGHTNLKELCQVQNPLELEKLVESLKIFDRLFADFELCYVAAMVPVKSTKEYEQQELVCVLFSETLQRALERGLLNQADVDNYEPALMFTIPRLAIVAGLLAPPGGPLCLNSTDSISEMFRPFRNLLLKIRELLWTLNNRELCMLEKLLCSNEEPVVPISQSTKTIYQQDLEEFVHNFYSDYPSCKDFIVDFYTVTKNTGTNMDEVANDAIDILNETNTMVERNTNPDRVKRKKRGKKRPGMSINYSTPQIDLENQNNFTSSRITTENHVHDISTSNLTTSPTGTTSAATIFTDVSVSNVENKMNGLAPSGSDINTLLPAPCQLHSHDYPIHNQNESSYTSPCVPRRGETSSSSVGAILENKLIDDPPMNDGASFFSTDISQILSVTENIEIPQTQYLLNQVSHENNISSDTRQIDNSLPDMDSRQLISEANKTLSTLLLDGGECPNEISEQTDSGICTVISSENTSLYDKSPEEKKIFANDIKGEGIAAESIADNYDMTSENPSGTVPLHSSSLPGPVERIHQVDESQLTEQRSCMEQIRSVKQMNDTDEIRLMNRPVAENTCDFAAECIYNHSLPVQSQTGSCCFITNNAEDPRTRSLTQNLNVTNNDGGFTALTYSTNQFAVHAPNQSSISLHYTDNLDNVNLNGDRQTEPNDFWNEFKCRNGQSTSRGIRNTGNAVVKCTGLKAPTIDEPSKGYKLRARNARRFQKKISKRQIDKTRAHCCHSCHVRCAHIPSELKNSLSNSIDRNHDIRNSHFATTLNPRQNTRQIPNFGSHSPQRSPRLCHFESRSQIPHQSSSVCHQSIQSLSPHIGTSFDPSDGTGEGSGSDDCEANGISKRTDFIEKHEALLNNDVEYKADESRLLISNTSSSDVTHQNCRLHCTKDGSNGETTRHNNGAGSSEMSSRTVGEIICNTRTLTEANASTSSSSYGESSSETSEFQSDCQDDVEIALAMQAAEIANRNQIRAKFRSSEDLVHRLFVCIAGVADQLQTNFASDLRNILKCVFLMNSSQIDSCHEDSISSCQFKQYDVSVHSTQVSNTNNRRDGQNNIVEESIDGNSIRGDVNGDSFDDEYDNDVDKDDEEHEVKNTNANVDANEAKDDEIDIDVGNSSLSNGTTSVVTERGEECVERAPIWVPDNDAPRCMACQAGFTVVRRRHHCRNCGKVFCGRCSSNNVPLPRYGHTKPVRVCNRCFLYQVTPFTVSHITHSS